MVAGSMRDHDPHTAEPPGRLTHLTPDGRARMVEVGAKPDTLREAVAKGEVAMRPETLALIKTQPVQKGDVLAIAQVAGIMAAKQTSQLIPLCHPLPLSGAELEFGFDESRSRLLITATVRSVGRTGVEMEALTAVTVAGLTVYDMCKAIDKGLRLESIRLVRKTGGRSGTYEGE